MQQLKLIVIVLVMAIFTSCSKEEFTPQTYGTTSFHNEYLSISVIDTLAKADSLVISIKDWQYVETSRIRIDIEHNRAPGAIIDGVGSYVSYAWGTPVIDNTTKLIFYEGEIGTSDLHRFRLEIDFGSGQTGYISLNNANINMGENYTKFLGATGTASISQFYHYQFGQATYFNLIVYN